MVFHWGTARGWGTGPALLPRCEPGLVEGVEAGPDPENKNKCPLENVNIVQLIGRGGKYSRPALPTPGFYIIFVVNMCMYMESNL